VPPTSTMPLSLLGTVIRWPNIATVTERTKEPSEFPRSSFLVVTVTSGRDGSTPEQVTIIHYTTEQRCVSCLTTAWHVCVCVCVRCSFSLNKLSCLHLVAHSCCLYQFVQVCTSLYKFFISSCRGLILLVQVLTHLHMRFMFSQNHSGV